MMGELTGWYLMLAGIYFRERAWWGFDVIEFRDTGRALLGFHYDYGRISVYLFFKLFVLRQAKG
jgi:hypothetical protein